MSTHKASYWATIVLVVAGLLIAGCGTAATEEPAPVEPVATEAPAPVEPTEAPAEPVVVRVAMTPFFDYQFFSVAKEYGWDKDLGLDLQFTWLTQSGPSIEAMAAGSVDTVNTCVVCNFSFHEAVPEMMDFLTVNQYKGFVVIGRAGEARPYADFLAELGTADAALKATLEQFRGKTWPEYTANYGPLISGMLSQADMTLDDITVVTFADDEKAALAMIGGTGDFYMGGLPSEINLLQNHPDEFVLIGGAELLGPAGLWYSQVAATDEWLAANEDAALKIMAMSYRYNRYIQEKRDTVMPLVVEAMNAHSGTGTTAEDLGFTFDTFLEFRTYQMDMETTYNPDSPLYWAVSAEYYVGSSTDLPEGFDYRLYNPLDEWFAKFLTRQDLLDWVDAPLT